MQRNQKLENLLQLALTTERSQREKAQDLNVGYSAAEGTWELIVKYQGELDGLEELGIAVEKLIAGYAILTVPERLIDAVADLEQIEYVEKPKSFYFEQMNPASEACVLQVTGQDFGLSGEGVLIGIADSGIDPFLPAFRKTDGTTRIRALWDQTIGTVEEGVYEEAQINRMLEEGERKISDITGHGTAVAGIAAGADEEYRGVAVGAQLLVVRLGAVNERNFFGTTQLMRALTWMVKKAMKWNMPLVINLSFGNNYGAHDGGSLLERFVDNVAEMGRTVICVGTGNEAAAGGHFEGTRLPETVSFAIAEYERNVSLQIWKDYSDTFQVVLRSPNGTGIQIPVQTGQESGALQMGNTTVLYLLGEPTPYGGAQEIYFQFLPRRGLYVDRGIWQISLYPVSVKSGVYHMYLSSSQMRNRETTFLEPSPNVTLTIPSTARKALAVGAYDGVYNAYAEFSGRGYLIPADASGLPDALLIKPDVVGEGVDVMAPTIYGGYGSFSGTSFSTPIVSGCCALLMEWGIVQGNDPYLYGEKVKAYLRKGALPVRGEPDYPNDKVGWGRICVRNSLPMGIQ